MTARAPDVSADNPCRSAEGLLGENREHHKFGICFLNSCVAFRTT